MPTRRGTEEAGYLQEQGLTVRTRRIAKSKPPRGGVPIVTFETDDWEGKTKPLIHAQEAILIKIDSLLADPNYARVRDLARAGERVTDDPELGAFCCELRAARAEHVRLCHALAPLWNAALAIGQVPMTERPRTHPWTALAMELLVTRYGGKADCAPSGHAEDEEQLDILRHFRKSFGVRVGEAWALAIVAEIHKAALERQNAAIRKANLDDEQLARFAATDPPANATAHAELVLSRTLDAMKAWPVRFELPIWLDAPLVAYFIGRYAFERGGGAGRKICGATLLKLLTNPKAFEEDLEKSRAAKMAFAANLDAVRRCEPIRAHAATPH
jgi:hypothetical protein